MKVTVSVNYIYLIHRLEHLLIINGEVIKSVYKRRNKFSLYEERSQNSLMINGEVIQSVNSVQANAIIMKNNNNMSGGIWEGT